MFVSFDFPEIGLLSIQFIYFFQIDVKGFCVALTDDRHIGFSKIRFKVGAFARYLASISTAVTPLKRTKT